MNWVWETISRIFCRVTILKVLECAAVLIPLETFLNRHIWRRVSGRILENVENSGGTRRVTKISKTETTRASDQVSSIGCRRHRHRH